MSRLIRIATAMMLAGVAIAAPGAQASRPVKKTVTACVIGGQLTSGLDTYRVRWDAGSAFLLPGDILIANTIKVVSINCP